MEKNNHKMDLFSLLNNVKDELTFIEFIKAIEFDYQNDQEHWQNHQIDIFFECAGTWAEDSIKGLEFYTKSENPWRRCADIIYMGKIYE